MRNLVLVFFLVAATEATAENEFETWGQSGNWSILVDPSNGSGCLMRRDFDDGLRIEFGFVPDRNGGFFAAYNQDWSQIETGTTGTVRFITNQAKFAGDVDMVSRGEWYGGWAFFNNPNLVVEMAQRQKLTVIGPKDGTFDVDLTGTARAIKQMKDCQKGQS